MKNLFDPTGAVRRVADYISFPEHLHDDVCFYGLSFAKDKEQIKKLRANYAEKVVKFSQMNHCGLNSNCSSFAEFLRSGAVINICKEPNFFSYYGDMYNYKGQHLNFGDIVGIHYLRDKEFNSGLFSSVIQNHHVHDFAEERRINATSEIFLKTYATARKYSSRYKKYKRKDLLEIERNIFFNDYHFLVCVGYQINNKTGNLEPVFIGQHGKNVMIEKDVKEGKILLPPFGYFKLSFISDYIEAGENTPAFVFCSKPL